ncbi:MAG TPA: flagellar hook-associated protein FlgK [Tepidisphaeraceae bacterium]|jgi:flagellar hook-associated protein 1 FlgK|nr:flagellar hook-associated protein FlgK [Tepidisphaeraceae bacterium]
MSLIGALNISSSALQVNQAALQVTGNNIANASDPNYTREVANTVSTGSQQIGQNISVGNGVDLTSIQRQIDEALNSRLRSSVSDQSAASTSSDWLTRIQSTFNELGDQDISTQMSNFFNSWSALASNPTDSSQQALVIQDGQNLAGQIQSVRSDLTDIQNDLGTSIKSMTSNANTLAQQVADLNKQIAAAQGSGGGPPNALLDQRDGVLQQLSQLVNISTTDAGNGVDNVYIGSQPLVMGSSSNGLTTTNTNVNGQNVLSVNIKSTGAAANITSGQLGSMVQLQTGQLQQTISQLDTLSSNLITEVNQVYSGGQGTEGYTNTTSTNAVTDPTAALDAAGLPSTPTTGSFVVGVYNASGQLVSSGLISVKLGADANGSPTTLNSLASSLGSIANITASVNNGKLTLSTGSSGLQIKFGDQTGDTSGTLAALGLNSFFSGTNASDISVNSAVAANSSLLATGDGITANAIATSIAGLQTQSISGLNGETLTSSYDNMINQVAVSVSSAASTSTAATTVNATLQAQRDNLSGVSMDEEAVNMIKQQRAFQGAAKLVSAIDDMMQTILNMVG